MSTEAVARRDERYEILDQIGHGGMADVYRARDRRLGRLVALKILRGGSGSDAHRARFLAEGRILAGLSHPGLITLLDVGLDDEQPFLVMELVDGRTLAGPRELADVAAIGRQLAEALAYAHRCGVVHRDVKPENVLIDADGRARLTDFGIARLLADAGHLTAHGKTIGTPAYLAPEQLRRGTVGPAADIYALGLVLIEAISGECAYTGPPMEAAVARLASPPSLPDGLLPGWQRLLSSMTSTDPLDRPTAAEVRGLLASLSPEGDVIAGNLSVGRPTLPQAVPIVGRGRRLLTVAILALMLSLGALVPHATKGPVASGSEIPQVAPSLQVALEDLHVAVVGLGALPGVGAQLDRIDRTLVERRYVAAAASLRALTELVKSAGPSRLADDSLVESAVAATRRLLDLLPIAPQPAVPPDGGSGSDVQPDRSPTAQPAGKAHPTGHDAKKPNNGQAKGHRH